MRSMTMATGRRYQTRRARPPSTAHADRTSRTVQRSRILGRKPHPSQPTIHPSTTEEQQLFRLSAVATRSTSPS